MNCRKWKSRTIVERVPEQPECPNCHARLIAVLKPWDEPHYAIVNKQKKTDDEQAIVLNL